MDVKFKTLIINDIEVWFVVFNRFKSEITAIKVFKFSGENAHFCPFVNGGTKRDKNFSRIFS